MKIYIHHLKQVHKVPEYGDADKAKEKAPDFFNCVVSSQLQIANYLKTKKNPIVVLEGFYQDAAPEEFKKIDVLNMTKLIVTWFPKGIPEHPGQLTLFQQLSLYEYGAVRILFYLGQIETIHRAISDKKTSDKIDTLVKKLKSTANKSPAESSLLNMIAWGKREQEALLCSKLAVVGSKKQEAHVYVVFGKAHNFEESIAKLKDPDLIYAESLFSEVTEAERRDFSGNNLTPFQTRIRDNLFSSSSSPNTTKDEKETTLENEIPPAFQRSSCMSQSQRR